MVMRVRDGESAKQPETSGSISLMTRALRTNRRPLYGMIEDKLKIFIGSCTRDSLWRMEKDIESPSLGEVEWALMMRKEQPF